MVDEPPLPELDGDGQSDEPDRAVLRFWDPDGAGDLDARCPDAHRLSIDRSDGTKWENVRVAHRVEAPAKTPPPFLRPDGSNNGVWMGRSAFILQNQGTAEEPNVIRCVAFFTVSRMMPGERSRCAPRVRAQRVHQHLLPPGLVGVMRPLHAPSSLLTPPGSSSKRKPPCSGSGEHRRTSPLRRTSQLASQFPLSQRRFVQSSAILGSSARSLQRDSESCSFRRCGA